MPRFLISLRLAISNITERDMENLVLAWTVNIITNCTGVISFKSKVKILAKMKTLDLYMATSIVSYMKCVHLFLV
jgi:hypothetical protein